MNSPKVKVCYAAPCTNLGYVAARNIRAKKVMVCAKHAAHFDIVDAATKKAFATALAARA